MKGLRKFFQGLDKLFPFLVPGGLILGILLGGRIASLSDLVPWIFGGVTFIGSLKMSFHSFKETIMNPVSIGLPLMVLRIIMPICALIMGFLVFQDDYTRMGLLLFGVIPTGINSAVWALMYKGNISLTLSVILIDTLLAPFVVPFSLTLLAGANVELDAVSMMISLTQMVVIPSLLGMSVNYLTKGEVNRTWGKKLLPLSKIGLFIVILINGSTVSPHLQTLDLHFIKIMVAVFVLAVAGFSFSWAIAKFMKKSREDTVAIVFAGGMRNNSTGIVIALAYFPSEVAIPVIVGTLFQQTVCAIFGSLMERSYKDAETEGLEVKVLEPEITT